MSEFVFMIENEGGGSGRWEQAKGFLLKAMKVCCGEKNIVGI